MRREMAKLEKSLGGIKDMEALPDALFVVDVGHERIALHEAKKLGIPVIAIVDTNCSRGRHRLRGAGQRRRHARHLPLCLRPRRRGAGGRTSSPQVMVEDDEFVELDEAGNPRRKNAAADVAGRPPAQATVRTKSAPPRRRPAVPGAPVAPAAPAVEPPVASALVEESELDDPAEKLAEGVAVPPARKRRKAAPCAASPSPRDAATARERAACAMHARPLNRLESER